jgi:hypothetical protein
MAVLMCSASVMAQHTPPPQQRGTMSQALESVGKNQANHPDNPGLLNARGRLFDNALRHLEHQEGKADKAGADRAQGPDRVERAERADRPDRAERPERPDRPERVARVDRPEPPGRAKK